jgi:hypothetical protein
MSSWDLGPDWGEVDVDERGAGRFWFDDGGLVFGEVVQDNAGTWSGWSGQRVARVGEFSSPEDAMRSVLDLDRDTADRAGRLPWP